MAQPVVSTSETFEFDTSPEGSERFGASCRRIGQELGLDGLGCMHIVVQPGKRAFPLHNHLGNDEMFFILAGKGTYRFGDSEYSVSAGDICGAPKGGPDKAHQLVNSGDAPLEYIAISTMNDPDVVEYPDSNKFAAVAVRPGPSFFKAHLRFIGRRQDSLDYYDGEAL